jgi:hypothetical protein
MMVYWSLIVEVELWILVHMRDPRMVVLGKSLPQHVSRLRVLDTVVLTRF